MMATCPGAAATDLARDPVRQVPAAALGAVSIRDTLPANMRLIAGSVVPPPAAIGSDGRIQWAERPLDSGGITVTLRLLPLQDGDHLTNLGATASFADTRGRTRHVDLPLPHVVVLQPFPAGGWWAAGDDGSGGCRGGWKHS